MSDLWLSHFHPHPCHDVLCVSQGVTPFFHVSSHDPPASDKKFRRRIREGGGGCCCPPRLGWWWRKQELGEEVDEAAAARKKRDEAEDGVQRGPATSSGMWCSVGVMWVLVEGVSGWVLLAMVRDSA